MKDALKLIAFYGVIVVLVLLASAFSNHRMEKRCPGSVRATVTVRYFKFLLGS
jgi:hypothetical protein